MAAAESDGEGSDGEGAAGANAALPPCTVCLICRLPDEPYVWMGRLAYDSHLPGTRPLKFTWRLADYDAGRAREDFRRVLQAGGVAGGE
jgi:hypothetical protein